jgi:hypothetical protein
MKGKACRKHRKIRNAHVYETVVRKPERKKPHRRTRSR